MHSDDSDASVIAGVKADAGKPRYDLLPWRAIEAVARVMTFGARKYSDDQWRRVPNARQRYFAAALRHLVAWYLGQPTDEESGEPHLAHAACCVLFLIEGDETNVKGDVSCR